MDIEDYIRDWYRENKTRITDKIDRIEEKAPTMRIPVYIEGVIDTLLVEEGEVKSINVHVGRGELMPVPFGKRTVMAEEVESVEIDLSDL